MSWYSGYDDDYPTCDRTYATFRMYHERLDPAHVSSLLEVEPTGTQRKGEVLHPRGGPPVPTLVGGWFLTSERAVDSKDLRRHVDWLLDEIEPRRESLRQLRQEGFHMDIACYWASEFTHGGPTLSPRQMLRLAELELDIWFDVYFIADATPAAS